MSLAGSWQRVQWQFADCAVDGRVLTAVALIWLAIDWDSLEVCIS
jgi:hypothetical protein